MKKRFCLGLAVVCAAAGFGGCGLGASQERHKGMEYYEGDVESVEYADELMPALDTLGEYENITYEYFYREAIICEESMSLFVEYGDTVYATKKTEALSAYNFYEEPLISFEDYALPVVELEYRGFCFRFTSSEDYYWAGCKTLLAVGYNDAANTIAYLYYYDADLDYICTAEDDPEEEMKRFMEEEFCWP